MVGISNLIPLLYAHSTASIRRTGSVPWCSDVKSPKLRLLGHFQATKKGGSPDFHYPLFGGVRNALDTAL